MERRSTQVPAAGLETLATHESSIEFDEWPYPISLQGHRPKLDVYKSVGILKKLKQRGQMVQMFQTGCY